MANITESASRAAVEGGLQRLAPQITSLNWLPDTHQFHGPDSLNEYLDTIVAGIPRGKHIGLGVPCGKELSEYLAVSTFSHLFSSTCYLSSAIRALIDGDKSGAVHYGYYAELRAVMSLLARNGMAVNKSHHLQVNDNSQAIIFAASGTHVACWDALSSWANTPRASELLSEIIVFHNITLGDWLDAAGHPKGTPLPKAAKWLEDWGIDIEKLTTDRKSRNIASYQPDFKTPIYGYPDLFEKSLLSIFSVWRLVAPKNFSSFDMLLIVDALKDRHANLEKSKFNPGKFKGWLGKLFEDANIPGGRDLAEELIKSTFAAEIKKLMKNDDKEIDVPMGAQILSRAVGLFRLAVGSALHLTRTHPDGDKLIREMLERIETILGIDTSSHAPEDLWIDIQQILDEIKVDQKHPKEQLNKDNIVVLSEFQRVLAWSIS